MDTVPFWYTLHFPPFFRRFTSAIFLRYSSKNSFSRGSPTQGTQQCSCSGRLNPPSLFFFSLYPKFLYRLFFHTIRFRKVNEHAVLQLATFFCSCHFQRMGESPQFFYLDWKENWEGKCAVLWKHWFIFRSFLFFLRDKRRLAALLGRPVRTCSSTLIQQSRRKKMTIKFKKIFLPSSSETSRSINIFCLLKFCVYSADSPLYFRPPLPK